MHHGRARAIAAALERWFQATARDLSFRRTRDPYAIWVSEIMLQQTRVDTVEGYFPRFIERFPNVETLAAASEDEVLGAWSGLGYYRRARLLHRGARWLVDRHQGKLPRGSTALREIPGVGAYTAGAISSIAFGDPEPLVDGNVARVLSRVEGVEDPREQIATADRHWRDAADIIGQGEPRVLAQAMMELGAVVCTPRAPRCEACPIAANCTAKARGLVDVIPAVKVKKASPTLHWLALAFDVGGPGAPSWLFVRRPEEGLLARMWMLPLVPTSSTSAADEAVPAAGSVARDGRVTSDDVRLALERLAGSQGRARVSWARLELRECQAVKHVFTHQTWRLTPWVVRGIPIAEAEALARATGAVDVAALGEGASPGGGLPTLTRRLLAAVADAAAEFAVASGKGPAMRAKAASRGQAKVVKPANAKAAKAGNAGKVPTPAKATSASRSARDRSNRVRRKGSSTR